MQAQVDNVRPGDKWVFNADVAACFDNMLARSIPAHDEMRRLVFDLGSRFVQERTDVLDLGCSRGAGLAPFVDRFGSHNRFVALDESRPMVDACRERFHHMIRAGVVDVRHHDLRRGVPAVVPSLTLAILTLQFVASEYRQRVVADVYGMTRPDGAMIVVEKIVGPDAATDNLFVETYLRHKREAGYSQDQIDAKRRSLEGVLVPLSADANETMLRAEGFRVHRFWQWCNFAGWLAVKPKGAN